MSVFAAGVSPPSPRGEGAAPEGAAAGREGGGPRSPVAAVLPAPQKSSTGRGSTPGPHHKTTSR